MDRRKFTTALAASAAALSTKGASTMASPTPPTVPGPKAGAKMDHGAMRDAVAASKRGIYAQAFARGGFKLGYYQPREVDRQQPHTQDELYIVAAGTGTFLCGETRTQFGPGDALFVPAYVVHRFEDFSDDLAVWVIFWGPDGGEQAEIADALPDLALLT